MGWVSINLNASKQYACRNDEQEPLFGDSWAQAERKNITEPGASLTKEHFIPYVQRQYDILRLNSSSRQPQSFCCIGQRRTFTTTPHIPLGTTVHTSQPHPHSASRNVQPMYPCSSILDLLIHCMGNQY